MVLYDTLCFIVVLIQDEKILLSLQFYQTMAFYSTSATITKENPSFLSPLTDKESIVSNFLPQICILPAVTNLDFIDLSDFFFNIKIKWLW